MKVLNLYAGIGGNRKLWEDVEVTAVEWDEQRAAVYADLFPDDTVIVGDAHQYLLAHYKKFDFIWSSPPCPTHGQLRYRTMVKANRSLAVYPDMTLWQEIVFLKHHAVGKYSVENTEPYYEPFWPAKVLGRHYFWSNFHISPIPKLKDTRPSKVTRQQISKNLGIILDRYDLKNKRQALRNCTDPILGKHILDCARGVQAQPLLIDYKQEALIDT